MNYKKMTVVIEKIVNGGNGLARTADGVIFIPYSLPGEKIIVNIIKKKKDYSFGEIESILEPSPWRIAPPCKYYYSCGGCQLQHAKYSKQLDIKYEIAKELFGGICQNIHYPIASEKEFNYRNKVIFRSENQRVGLLKEKSHQVVDIESCMIADKKINYCYGFLREKLKESSNEITVRVSDQSQLQINLDRSINIDRIAVNEIDSLYINGYLEKGWKYISNKGFGIDIPLFPDSFFQVNYDVTVKMKNILQTKVKGNVLLDAYCGVGIFSFLLKDNFNKTIGVDISKQNIKNANIIKKKNSIENSEFYTAKVRNMLDQFEKADCIILDPPRKGLSEKVKERLIETKNDNVIYISCFASTLKRDLMELSQSYTVEELFIMDMFPQTYHFENIAFLKGIK